MDQNALYFPPFVTELQEEIFLGLTLFIFLGWWAFFAARHKHSLSPSERFLAAFVMWVAQIVIITIILGFFRRIGWWEQTVLNGVITSVLFSSSFIKPSGHDILAEIYDFFLSAFKLIKSSVPLTAAVIIVGLVAFWNIYFGQLVPPYGHDAWGYHLTWTCLANQERHLGPFEFPHNYVNYYPMNGNIFFLWSATGTGTVRWATIMQGIFAVYGVFACYLVARGVGARRVDAAIAGLLLLSVPSVTKMMCMAYVDVMTMTGMLCSLAFLSRQKLIPVAVILGGLSAGFTAGSKGLGIYMMAALVLLMFYRFFPLGWDGLKYRSKSRVKGILLSILLFVLTAYLLGGYFYTRNWVLTGNPTGIFQVEVAGHVLFEGPETVKNRIANEMLLGEKLFAVIEENKQWPVVFDGFFDPMKLFSFANGIGGWGSVWTIFLLPAIPIAVIWAAIRKRWSVVVVIICCLIPFFLFEHNRFWPRFHLQIICAGTTAFAYLTSLLRFNKFRQPILIGAIISLLITSFMSFPMKGTNVFDVIREAREEPYLATSKFITIDSLSDPSFGMALDRVQLPGTTFAVTQRFHTRKMFGGWNQNLTNRMIWAPFREPEDKWLQRLRDNNVLGLYTLSDDTTFEYADSHPDIFTRIYLDDQNGSIFIMKDEHGN